MDNSNWDTSGVSPPFRPVKREPTRIPSPTASAVTILKPGRPSSPTPSCSSTVLFGGRGPITIRPLSAITDEDDQMSTVSGVNSSHIPKRDPPFESSQTIVHNENDWRSSLRCVGDRLKYIYENDNKYQDVIFEVEGRTSKQQFKAHKLILRIASSVFDRLFQVDDLNKTNISTITVTDVEPNVFSLVMRYIYTDKVDTKGSDGDELISLLQAAKHYGLRPLYLECVKILKTRMSDTIAVKICEIATSYDDKVLLDTALDHIANKAFQIFPSEEFLRLNQEHVFMLFTRNDLRIDEVALFEAAIKWGEQKCIQKGMENTPVNLRKVMQNLIPEIRFPLMRPDEFTLLVIPTKLLSADEQVGIYQYLCVDTTKQSKLPPISFKTTPRLSQKCLELDSSSSSDYRERSSASPEQPYNLTSVPITDSLDLTTTEAESETASTVSTYSENGKKSRKYERSLSHSSGSSTKKRRKTENERKRHKSMDKSVKPDLNDLFGDFDNKQIELKNTTISLNNFISDLSRHENRRNIESITLENVKIEDSKKLNGEKVYFSRLKKFELNIQIDESISGIIAENNFVLEKYLFFDCPIDKEWRYDKLWEARIDITVIINSVIVLRLSHEANHVVLNKFNGAPTVLKSLYSQPIKSLVYSHTHFTDKYFPLSLHRMVVLGVVSSQCMSGFIQQFKQLKELTVVSPATTVGNVSRSLTLDKTFSSKDKIRKLGLGSFKLHLEPSIRFYNIVELSLWRVSWESYFEEKFHHTFPKLQDLYLIGPVTGSPKLLKNILKIGSMKKLINWQCDFHFEDGTEGSEVKKMLSDYGLSEPDMKKFVLKKKTDNKGWEGSKITYKDYNQYFYKQFEYEYLYADIQTFTNTSKGT